MGCAEKSEGRIHRAYVTRSFFKLPQKHSKAKPREDKNMKKVLLPLASGFEEIEFISTADILRRAGVEVVIASLGENLLVNGAHDIAIKADCELKSVDITDFDAIALAGGYNGMMNLKANERVLACVKALHASGKLIAAICASPIVLNAAGVFDERTEFSCYPSCEEGLKGVFVRKAVCESGNIITSAGPATATLFALALVKKLCGADMCAKLEKELLVELVK